MPAPIKRDRRYMPGIDGLRAIAVIGVIAYHLDFGWAQGGLLGVGVFFTLSGYLITDLLLAQVGKGGIRLKDFWFARARRLLPALFVMLVIVTAWVTTIGPHQPPDYRQGVGSAVAYVNNWWLIFHDVSYFAQFATPGPLNHLWSLSVEEQFYIVWPFLLLLAVRLIPEVGFSTGVRFRLGGAILLLALASAIWMAVLYRPGIDPSRVYYGTDTRALELLIGAALATIWPSQRLRSGIRVEARRLIELGGGVGLLVIFVMFWRADEFSPFLYRGGFLLLSLATALAVAALAHPASRLAAAVGCPPLRWIGERSYGIYLWHFPIIILTTPEGVRGTDLTRDLVQVAATIAVAALSWTYIENPIRHGALKRLRAQIRAGAWQRANLTSPDWAVLAVVGLTLAIATAGLAGVGVGPSLDKAPGNVDVAETSSSKQVVADASRTSCNSVVHIGDSTSEGLVSADYLPIESQRIAAQYGRVGATTQHLEVSGARSIYETFEGAPNAFDVATSWKSRGFDGCWVFALGTNEAANVAAGSTIGYDQRIDSMMSVTGRDPVLWVNVRSLETTGPYASANMKAWNNALLGACNRYPQMRIYDWAADAKDKWFVPDGIHFTTTGYASRSRLIAGALLQAFPFGVKRTTNSSDCVIEHPDPPPKPKRGDRSGKAGRGNGAATATPAAPGSSTTPATTDPGAG